MYYTYVIHTIQVAYLSVIDLQCVFVSWKLVTVAAGHHSSGKKATVGKGQQCDRGSCYGIKPNGDVVEQSRSKEVNCSETFRP